MFAAATNPAEKSGGKIEWPPIVVAIAAALVTAALVWYANTEAFAEDEGYHLVAAWLIAHGKQPYIDFVFPQTPLNAYWNAFLLRVVGQSWHVPHTAGALLTAAAAAMMAACVYVRLPVSRAWRGAAAVATVVVIGLNTAICRFGALQAYGLCLFAIVAAYLLTVSAVDRPGILRPALAGLASAIAASSSLLTAPVAPVLLVWMLIVNRAGSRLKKFLSFCAGVLVALIPLLRLLIQAPHQVIFGILQYQLLYRRVEWDDASLHNVGEVLSWADSSQAVLLVLFAAAGIAFIRKKPATRVNAEIWLCAALSVTIGAFLLAAQPTFTRYFLFTVPFLAFAAAYGLCEIADRLSARPRPWLAAGILCALTAYGLAATLFEEKDDLMWSDISQIAAKVHEVTPPGGVLLADETVYFFLNQAPPSGMELEDSHKLTSFSDAEAKALHVLPRPKLDLMIKADRFDTIEMCDDDEVSRLDLAALYSKSATVGDCQIFWNWAGDKTK